MKIAIRLNAAFTGLAVTATLILGGFGYLIGYQTLLRYAEADLQDGGRTA